MTLPVWIAYALIVFLSLGALAAAVGLLAPLWLDDSRCETCGGFGYLEDSSGNEGDCWTCWPGGASDE